MNALLDQVEGVVDGHWGKRAQGLREFSRAFNFLGKDSRLAGKIQAISWFMTDSPFDSGRKPFQDFDLLLDIRNWLIHQRPETVVFTTPATREAEIDWTGHHLTKRLLAAGLYTKDPQRMFEPLIDILGRRDIGIWAYNTAAKMILGLLDCLELNLRQSLMAPPHLITEILP